MHLLNFFPCKNPCWSSTNKHRIFLTIQCLAFRQTLGRLHRYYWICDFNLFLNCETKPENAVTLQYPIQSFNMEILFPYPVFWNFSKFKPANNLYSVYCSRVIVYNSRERNLKQNEPVTCYVMSCPTCRQRLHTPDGVNAWMCSCPAVEDYSQLKCQIQCIDTGRLKNNQSQAFRIRISQSPNHIHQTPTQESIWHRDLLALITQSPAAIFNQNAGP